MLHVAFFPLSLTQDVGDVIAAIDRVTELGYVDPSRIAVVGGSHGGFLAAHLIGQVRGNGSKLSPGYDS